ncbi:MAG TPA: SUMF1/EgtB/PvdO family nonheme iron enzyme [Waterburya sp.]|jgi:formylglycine-generating enzyme required for sulfatase activity/uncharacterized caspase-like protein
MGRNWAITIGINQYDNLAPLKYAKRDAEAVRDFCLKEVGFDKVYYFSDDSPPIEPDYGSPMRSQPTYGVLSRFLRVRFEQPFLEPGDNLWFFFAGHGKRHRDRDYLMPIDADPGNIDGTAIPINDITGRLRRCGADNVILVLDACRNEGDRDGQGIGLETQQGIVTLFSCSPNERSYEIDELQHGSFTYSLLQGLRIQGEGNCATVERLYQHLRYQVPELNRRYNKPRQTPYPIAEPATKLHLILLPKQANESDVRTLKNDAFEAEAEGNLELAEQLWIRVLAVSPVDQQAIKGIKRIAQASAVAQPLNQQPLPLNQPILSRSIEQSSISSKIPVIASNKRRKVRASAKGVEFAKSALKQKRLSQKALAEQYGLSPNTISRFMKQELIDYEIFDIISKALNLKQEEITDNTSATPSISNSPRIKSSETVFLSSDIQTIEFQVISVDERGQEVDRYHQTSEHHIEALGDGIVLEMVLIPNGTFLMGSPETEPGRLNNEEHQHSVTVTSFLMGKYPITQAQWTVVASLPKVHQDLELDPSHFKGTDRPVEQVSWHDAVEFCARLSSKTGHEYRLPTEAEWEYACRAGTITPFHFGESITPKLSNYDCNYRYRSSPKGTYRKQTSPVGYFPFANAFGLFDMHGNVWEWCLDQWHQNYDDAPTNGSAWLTDSKNNLRVLRGGSWYNDPRDCRSAFRYNWDSEDRLNRIGFRVVCPLP